MTDEQIIQKARQIAAAAFDLAGCDVEYSNFMREGVYDSDPTVKAALAALKFGLKGAFAS